jgi:putative glutamine amidotransferase
LQVEALSDDGVVEGVSMPGNASFVAAVQWHAEYKVEANTFNRALFEAFGHASRRRAAARAGADVA